MFHINWRGLLGLPSKYVGIVYNTKSKKVCKVINPTYDIELYDDCWTKNNEEETLIRIKRGDIPVHMNTNHCVTLIQKIEKQLESNDPSISY
jgi:hypothetical protein